MMNSWWSKINLETLFTGKLGEESSQADDWKWQAYFDVKLTARSSPFHEKSENKFESVRCLGFKGY